ncbi:MAG: hypothetical protein U0670_02800 [Anaerolineae bacterium]
MTNKPDDFEFDDFFDDEGGDIGGDDEPPISGDFDEDMPVIDEEPERSNRTFVIIAIALILIFIIGVAIILVIAAQPKGPTEAELTATAAVAYNSTIQAFAAQTATQDLNNIQATQTALSFTATPSDTPTNTPTNTPEPATATPTIDLTATALMEALDSVSRTQTALAASPTPTDTLPPSPTQPGAIDFQRYFSTEVAQATQIGQLQQSAYATAAGFATQAALGTLDPAAIQSAGDAQATVQAGLDAQIPAVQEAVGQVDIGLATSAAVDATQAFNLALATSNAPGFQQPLIDAALQATQNAGNLAATVTALPPSDPGAQAATVVALSQQSSLGTPFAQATQNAFATRQSFIAAALGTVIAPPTETPTPVPPTVDLSLNPVNQTATAIAGAFQTATALAAPVTVTATVEAGVVPPTESFPVLAPTALPNTGLFDDLSGNGTGIGVLGIALFGLVGVIVVARVMRSRNK